MSRTLFLPSPIAAILCLCLGVLVPAHAIAQTDRQNAAAVEAAFTIGLAALEAGDPATAIPIFRSILASDPGLVRVRLELGRAYFFNRQWSDAREQFTLALSRDLPRPVRQNVLGFLRRIDARRGFDWSLDLALTRLGDARSYDSDIVGLDFGGGELPFEYQRDGASGLGLSFDVSARRSLRLGDLPGTDAAATAFVEPYAFGDYAGDPDLRDLTYGLRGGLRLSAQRVTTTLSVFGQQRDLAAESFSRDRGVALSVEGRTGQGLLGVGRVGWRDIDNRRNDGRDGHAVDARLSLQQSISGRASLGASVFGTARRAVAASEEFDRYGAAVFGRIEPGAGLEIDGEVFVAHRDYLSPSPLFVDDQDADEIGGTIRLTKVDFYLARRFVPYVELAATRVDSGIDAFSYTERSLRLGLEKAF